MLGNTSQKASMERNLFSLNLQAVIVDASILLPYKSTFFGSFEFDKV